LTRGNLITKKLRVEGDKELKSQQKDYAQISKSNYKSYVFETSPKSSHWKNMIWAFLIGGLICVVGQLLIALFIKLGLDKEMSSTLASSVLVALAAITTGIGIYDRLGRFAGAGSTIPITGFSNAIVAPAIEFRSEGLIYGIGAKMFTVAGPVIVNGVSVAVIIALLTALFGG